MNQPDRDAGLSVVLWAKGSRVCTVLHRPDNTAEIHLTVDRVRVDSVVFKDFGLASAYAIKLLRSYEAA